MKHIKLFENFEEGEFTEGKTDKNGNTKNSFK
jgi:hypothetical protein